MNGHDWSTLTAVLSARTLQPYRGATKGDLTLAATLYEWDRRISGALWMALDHAKAAIINTIDVHLKCHTLERGSVSHWLFDDSGSIGRRTSIAGTHHKPPFLFAADLILCTTDTEAEHPENLFPRISPEFWKSLMSSDTYSLWPALKIGFNVADDEEFSELCALFSDVLTLHTAITQQSPVFAINIDVAFYDALRLTSFVDEDFAMWIYQTSLVPSLLAEHPLAITS